MKAGVAAIVAAAIADSRARPDDCAVQLMLTLHTGRVRN